jgi:putative selenate reductase
MEPVGLKDLLEWILNEYLYQRSVFGIPEEKFFFKKKNSSLSIFSRKLDLPLGPAAGPHTQMSQNIASAYLCGARFFELKTVQKLDQIRVNKPCIDAEDEVYNVEWSQELPLEASFQEYLKAWFLIHFLNAAFGLSDSLQDGFIFNMSVGYSLEGIVHETVDRFIEGMKDASKMEAFERLRDEMLSIKKSLLFQQFESSLKRKINGRNLAGTFEERLIKCLDNISPFLSNSVTLSTMHGCPPAEIESIAKYLIKEKGLNTFVKLNPTLLDLNEVERILNRGKRNFLLDEDSFMHDLKFNEATDLIRKLRSFSEGLNRSFGIKLSNTLPVKNTRGKFSDEVMYMSGRTLFPLTVNLALRLIEEFKAKISISFSGGASSVNIIKILSTGIYPVTLASDLLKPGGYMRLKQMADLIEESGLIMSLDKEEVLNHKALERLAEDSIKNPAFSKSGKYLEAPKVPLKLKMFDCYIAPCMESCPIGQDIPDFIKFIKEGSYARAFEVIVSKNPLPNITGYICDRRCTSNCTRCQYDFPVRIRELKKSAAEKGYTEYLSSHTFQFKANGIKAAILGAGPAGLSAGYFLSRAGFEVTVFETSSKAGGTVRHIIPGFRIPQEAIDRDVELIEKYGVKFVFNASPDFSIGKLKEDGFKYIYVAIGAAEPNTLSIKGDGKVYTAIDFLRAFNLELELLIGKNVAVIGGGNSAMDSARSAKRLPGTENVYIIYRRTREFMPADKEELTEAISEGVVLKELLQPVSFSNKRLICQKMELTKAGEDGRMGVKAADKTFIEMEIDTIISAVGEHIDYELLRKNNLTHEEYKTPRVNLFSNESLLENVFIGGDTLRGPSSVINAISDGRKTAGYIIAKEELEVQEDGLSMEKKFKASEILRLKGNVLEASDSDLEQAERCLQCSYLCNICVEVCPNRANVLVPSGSSGLFHDKFQILHIDRLCNECGNCETFCPYEGAPYKDKLTLFQDEKSFSGSNNNGFYVKKDSSGTSVVARYNDQAGTVVLDNSNEVISSSFNADPGDESLYRFIKTITLILKNQPYILFHDQKSELYSGGNKA